MNRRDFIRAAIILGAGATASVLYGITLAGQPVAPRSSSQTSSITNLGLEKRLSDPNVPTEYKDFLRWLRSVAGPYSGRRISVSLQDEPDYRALQRLDIDFFAASNINSQYDLRPYILNLEKTRLAVQTSSPAVDIIDFDSLDIPLFKDYLLQPNELADKYPNLTYPGLNLNDFESVPMNLIANYPPKLSDASTPAGQMFCFPFNTPLMIRFYRRDIYDTYRISQPVTWDDFFQSVKSLTLPQLNIFGCVSQASITTPIFHEFLNHLYSFGGRFWKISGNNISPTVNQEQNILALENFARFNAYAHPSSITNTWEDAIGIMQHGQAANAIAYQDFSALLDDPLRSLVVGSVGYSPNPSGPSGAFSNYVGDGIGISKYSRNPEAAWLWLQWATATGTQMMLVADSKTRYLPSRISASKSSFVQEKIATSAYESVRVSQDILSSGNISFSVPFNGSRDAADVIARKLFDAYTGRVSPRDALNVAQTLLEGNSYSF